MKSLEQKVAEAMLAGNAPSVLMTDAYKFSMGQAGFPLRPETFYLSFRKRGWYLIPFDLAAVIQHLRPRPAKTAASRFLAGAGYQASSAMVEALSGALEVRAAPAGAWIRETEPILTITAPSFFASVLEPMTVWLNYPIQVATAAVLGGQKRFVCCCQDEATITTLTLEAVGIKDATVTVDEAAYGAAVINNTRAALDAIDHNADRLMEVGMRAATCLAMHQSALEAAAKAGLEQTSNLHLAWQLVLRPVGTSGHEHQQRWGDDLEAFRALRDMRSQPPGYLVDTFDTQRLGLPAALCAIGESDRPCGVRFDSGDQTLQTAAVVAAGAQPTFVFMDGMNPEKIAELECTTAALGVPADRRVYGCGGWLVSDPAPTDLTRNNVAAVYKLCQSGSTPVMKFSVPGKRSVPGQPVIFRRIAGHGPVGLIGQLGEPPPAGYLNLAETRCPAPPGNPKDSVGLSSATAGLVERLSSTLAARRAA